MRTALFTAAGVAILLVTLRDVVHELFHPEITGSLSRQVMKVVWRLFRLFGRVRRRSVHHAGPAILIAVMLTWACLVVLGFALLYLPHLPDGFLAQPGLPWHERRGFFTALFISMSSLTTLGPGGLSAQTDGLRYLTSVESLVGLVLFTAWITWVLSIYPVLAERRAFCREVVFLRDVYGRPERCVADDPPDGLTQLLRSLAEQVVRASARLTQARVTYYFQSDSTELTLARQLPFVLELARAAEGAGGERGVRQHGRMLREATEQLLREIGAQYLDLPDAPPEPVLRALEKDHMLDRA